MGDLPRLCGFFATTGTRIATRISGSIYSWSHFATTGTRNGTRIQDHVIPVKFLVAICDDGDEEWDEEFRGFKS